MGVSKSTFWHIIVYLQPFPIFVLDYLSMYNESITQPDKFWGSAAKQFLEWDKTFTKVSECRKEEGLVQWFTGGQLNVTSEQVLL